MSPRQVVSARLAAAIRKITTTGRARVIYTLDPLGMTRNVDSRLSMCFQPDDPLNNREFELRSQHMSAVISALLYVELGDTSARQRTILRRVLLGQRWRPLEKHDFAFVMEIRGATSDHQILDRATRNVHAAVAAAAVSDWSAECILAQGPFRERGHKSYR